MIAEPQVLPMPAVTVLMSCYNASRYLAEAMESIRSQKYGDYEFLVVNDGSTDGTLETLQEYAVKDRRIRILNKVNTGLADSLNTGMRMARGTWIARQDADDVALPDRLAQQIAYIASHPSTVLLGTGFIEIDGTGRALRTYRYPASREKYMRRIQKTGRFAPHSSCLYHKATVERLGRYNPRFRNAQDTDLWFRLCLAGEVAALSQPLVKIRKHAANISNEDSGKIQATFGMAARVCHRLRLAGAADPSVQADADWQQFLHWITRRVEHSALFAERHEWTRLRDFYYSAPNRTVGAWRLLKGLVASPHVMQILRKKYFGSTVAATLAKEWIDRSCAALLE